MINRSQIQEHMEVLDKAGRHLGWVECRLGEGIRLTPSASARHAQSPRIIPLDWVERLDCGRLRLDRDGTETDRRH